MAIFALLALASGMSLLPFAAAVAEQKRYEALADSPFDKDRPTVNRR